MPTTPSRTPFSSLSLFVHLANVGVMVHLDFNAVEAVVDATHRYKEIFYDSGE